MANDPEPYLDLDNETVRWVPFDPENRHRQMVDKGWLAKVDAETGEVLPGEIDRANATRPVVTPEAEQAQEAEENAYAFSQAIEQSGLFTPPEQP